MPIVGQGAADEHVAVSTGRDVAVRQKDLRDYLRILWRRKWIVALAVVIAMGVSVGAFLHQQRQYRASAEVLTEAPTPGTSVDPTVIATEIGILQSNAVRAIVAKHIGDPGRSRRTRYSPERSSRSVRHRRRRIWQQNRRMRGPMRTLPIADHWPKARRSGRLP